MVASHLGLDPWEGATRWVQEADFMNGTFANGNEFD